MLDPKHYLGHLDETKETYTEKAEPRTIGLSLRLNPETHEVLRRIAFDRRVSIHSLLLEGVAAVIQQPEPTRCENENAIWREFACAVASYLLRNECCTSGCFAAASREVADFADAMLEECKARGRV